MRPTSNDDNPDVRNQLLLRSVGRKDRSQLPLVSDALQEIATASRKPSRFDASVTSADGITAVFGLTTKTAGIGNRSSMLFLLRVGNTGWTTHQAESASVKTTECRISVLRGCVANVGRCSVLYLYRGPS